jgi:hypothetical protein
VRGISTLATEPPTGGLAAQTGRLEGRRSRSDPAPGLPRFVSPARRLGTSNLSTQVPAIALTASCTIPRQVYGMVPPGTGAFRHMGAWAAPRERGPVLEGLPEPVPAVPGLRLRARSPGLRDARSPAAGLPGAGGIRGVSSNGAENWNKPYTRMALG